MVVDVTEEVQVGMRDLSLYNAGRFNTVIHEDTEIAVGGHFQLLVDDDADMLFGKEARIVSENIGVYAAHTIDASATNVTLKANKSMEVAVQHEMITRAWNTTMLSESYLNLTSGDYMTFTTNIMTISAQELVFEALGFLDIKVMEDIWLATDRTRFHMSSGGQVIYHALNWTSPLFFFKSRKVFP
jgi:hypothetical protein